MLEVGMAQRNGRERDARTPKGAGRSEPDSFDKKIPRNGSPSLQRFAVLGSAFVEAWMFDDIPTQNTTSSSVTSASVKLRGRSANVP